MKLHSFTGAGALAAAALAFAAVPTAASATLVSTPPPPRGAERGLAILRPCPASQLKAAVTSDQGAMMHRELTITLTNAGASACVIDGFPAVRLIDELKHARIAAESFSGTPKHFIIAPDQQAAFKLRIATGDGVTSYMTVPTLAIIPPGDVVPLYVKVELPSAPTIDVTALAPAAETK
ncbi:MAG TPA: DUF4232 domain-containing protein [Candidatus Elarobacter sp.]|jgi:hypothetical protein|nr:DUF4232 domain-containing protein [Candidatus Elarobacter sp.]